MVPVKEQVACSELLFCVVSIQTDIIWNCGGPGMWVSLQLVTGGSEGPGAAADSQGLAAVGDVAAVVEVIVIVIVRARGGGSTLDDGGAGGCGGGSGSAGHGAAGCRRAVDDQSGEAAAGLVES